MLVPQGNAHKEIHVDYLNYRTTYGRDVTNTVNQVFITCTLFNYYIITQGLLKYEGLLFSFL